MAMLTESGLDVTTEEHFPDTQHMDAEEQEDGKRSNELNIKLDAVRAIPEVADFIESTGFMNAVVCQRFCEEYRYMVPKCKVVLILTMYDWYDNKKLGSLRYYDDKHLQYQLQAGPMVCGNAVVPLFAGKIYHLSRMPCTWVRKQAVSVLKEAMEKCPLLGSKIPSPKRLTKIELAFCFPSQFDKKVQVIRLTQSLENRNTMKDNMKVCYANKEFWDDC